MKILGDYIKECKIRNKNNKNLPVYSVTNSQGFCKEYFSKEVASKNKRSYKIVPYGAFAYNPSRINVGSVDWQHYEKEIIVSPLYNVFTVSEELMPDYLFYYLRSNKILKRINVASLGSVRNNLRMSSLKEFPIKVPSKEKQMKIVNRLILMQNIIAHQNEMIRKLDILIKARFVEMFDKDFPIVKLSDIAKYWNGLTYKPSDVKTQGTIVLRSCNIINNEINFKNIICVNCSINNSKIVKQNDILMCSRNGSAKLVGKVALIPKLSENMSFGAFMMIIRSNYYPYLLTYFKLPQFRSQLTTGTTTINQITKSMLNFIKVPLPPRSDIKKYDSFLHQVDKSKFIQ